MKSSLVAAPATAGLFLLDRVDLGDGGVGEPRALLGVCRCGHAHAQSLHRRRLLRVQRAQFVLLKGQTVIENNHLYFLNQTFTFRKSILFGQKLALYPGMTFHPYTRRYRSEEGVPQHCH